MPSPFFTGWPSGARNAILKSTSATGGTPISVDLTAASSPSTSKVRTRAGFFSSPGRPPPPAPAPPRPVLLAAHGPPGNAEGPLPRAPHPLDPHREAGPHQRVAT